MTAPLISSNWPDVYESLELLEETAAERVKDTVQEFQPLIPVFTAYASSLHPTKSPCTVSDRYVWGQSYVVYEVIFEDSTSWVVRLGMKPDLYGSETQLARKITNEVAALKVVQTRTTIKTPSLIAFHPIRSESNPLGPTAPPFVILTSVAGQNLSQCGVNLAMSGCDPLQGDPSRQPILDNYLNDLANIHIQLSAITFPAIGSFVLQDDGSVTIGPDADFGLGPFTTATEYFSTHADAYDQLALTDPSSERVRKQFVSALWRKAMLPLINESDDNGPFPMQHGDLHIENVLVDSSGHIVAVLDWDCAGTVPWEKIAVPTFEVSEYFVDHASSIAVGETRDERLAVHRKFNAALVKAQEPSTLASKRTLADLHDSEAGQVCAYMAYWMYSMELSYDTTGRALHAMYGSGGDIDSAFMAFLAEKSAEEDIQED